MKYSYNAALDNITCEPDCVEEVLEWIEVIAMDYDGEGESKQGLRNLVDEMKEMANQAYTLLREGRIYFNGKTDEDSYFAAKADREAHMAEWKVGK